MSIKIKLIFIWIAVSLLVLVTGILVAVSILDEAIENCDNTAVGKVVAASAEMIKNKPNGGETTTQELDTLEHYVLQAMAFEKQRTLFRNQAVLKYTVLLALNFVPYFILGYIVIVITVHRMLKPISRLARATATYPELAPDDLDTDWSSDREVRQLIGGFRSMLERIEGYQNKIRAQSVLAGRIEMSRAIVHEVGNILVPARNKVRQYQSEYPEAPHIREIAGAVERLERLFAHVRAFYRSGAVTKTEFDIIRELAFLCEGYAVAFANKSGTTSVVVSAGRVPFVQIFTNLIKNAVEATAGRPEPRVHISVEREARDVLVKVEDNGAGFKNPQIKGMFVPGFSAKKEGFGIGLAIVDKNVTLHDWHIAVDSTYNVGTTFTIRIYGRDLRETIGADS